MAYINCQHLRTFYELIPSAMQKQKEDSALNRKLIENSPTVCMRKSWE